MYTARGVSPKFVHGSRGQIQASWTHSAAKTWAGCRCGSQIPVGAEEEWARRPSADISKHEYLWDKTREISRAFMVVVLAIGFFSENCWGNFQSRSLGIGHSYCVADIGISALCF